MGLAARLERVRGWLGRRRPRVALVLGSGLGGLARRLDQPSRLPYGEIPGFPPSGVEGHAGELVCGTLAGVEVLLQSGRFHAYEGHEPDTVALPIRLMAQAGIETVIVTNAAGGIGPALGPGSLMLITDQVNLTGRSATRGPAVKGELRFPDMSAPFDSELMERARLAARERRIALAEGVYAGVLGPSYETPAEIRALHRLGADAVGMSTVLEVIVARASGVRCLGFSVITNRAAGLAAGALTHGDVLLEAGRAAERLGTILESVVGSLRE
jgi:purine-nucleoside phosphorylase